MGSLWTKIIAAIGSLAALVLGLFVYNRNQQRLGEDRKTASDLKEIDKMVARKEQDVRKHEGLQGDELKDALQRQQDEWNRRRK